MRTRATRADGGWRLNGSKVFISHAAEAGIFLVAATIDPSRGHRGVTMFLVDPSIRDGDHVLALPEQPRPSLTLNSIPRDKRAVPSPSCRAGTCPHRRPGASRVTW